MSFSHIAKKFAKINISRGLKRYENGVLARNAADAVEIDDNAELYDSKRGLVFVFGEIKPASDRAKT